MVQSGKMVVFGQRLLYSVKWLYLGKSGCNWAKVVVVRKVVVLGKSGCNRAKVVVFGQNWMCLVKLMFLGQKGSIRASWLYLDKNSCIRAKSGCIRAN